ncbi:MAG TPA: PBP1A family penicillin-binding protein [Gaiellaceae bacterium]|nr:PBP1A family penicillin-binding protein [Gaiellaceae bacterium]
MTPPPKRRPPRRDTSDPVADVRRRRKRRHERLRKRRRVAFALGLLGAILVVLLTVGFGAGAALSSSCDLNSLRPVEIGQNSFVYAADGSLLGSIPAEKNRQPIALSQMSRWLPKATVAIEDRRFYEHGGVDYQGIVRAAWADLTAGKVVQGASTITQQLVRNLYIGHNERTIQRKLTEACLAIKLSRERSHDWILDNYMNQVYYGNQAYGIEAAAQTYFARHARSLTLPQAALLAGLPQAPSAYDPFHAPEKAIVRRNEVLAAMLATHDITRRQYLAARRAPLRLRPGKKLYTKIRQPYFFSYVIDELQQQYGTNTVRTGGLKVYTTIDPRLQRVAKTAMRKTLPYRTDPASALISIDPANGDIRAMTAVTPGTKGNQYNLVSQATRQPGSTFKSFVLAAAVAQGMNPDSTYYDSAPFTCSTGPWCIAQPWSVHTYDNTYVGYISVTRATLRSDNSVYAQLTLDVGPDRVRAMAERLGVHISQKTVASIGLGSLAVSPLDMASAYAAFATGGILAKPTAIRKVVLADGKTDTQAGWGKPKRTRVLPDWVADEVTNVLSQNIRYGTGYPNATLYDRPAAGKTGTTENHADAWFDGYTPDLSTVVWVGYPKGEIPMTNVHGIAVTGGSFPAMIWHSFMTSALAKVPPHAFPVASTQPAWRSDALVRGHYSLGYVPTYSASTSTTTETTTAPATTAKEPKPSGPAAAAVSTTTAPPPPATVTVSPVEPTTTEPAAQPPPPATVPATTTG